MRTAVRFDGTVTEPSNGLVDASIAELRAIHDRLAATVAGLSADQLTAQSGTEDWRVCDVLSHLGSGSEIWRYPLVAGIGAPEEQPSNQEVWDRWNAMTPADQASGFVEAQERLVAAFEALTPEQRDTVRVDLGFLPQPVPLATTLGMRLNEVVLHGWDVEAGLDPAASLSDRSAALVLRHLTETLAFMVGFMGKPEGAPAVRLALGDHSVVLDPDDGVRLEAGTEGATATFHGPVEAGVRLLAGRLKPEFTPADVSVSGDITLDELRKVFPGY
jgi:uncharacterized protein (TIGR03083 family)